MNTNKFLAKMAPLWLFLSLLAKIVKGIVTSSVEVEHGDDRDMRSRFAEQTIKFWRESKQEDSEEEKIIQSQIEALEYRSTP